MEQIILEANRLRSITVRNQTTTDPYNNNWTNNVSTSGIPLSAGDIISIDAAAINTKGNNVSSTMEFRGTTENEFQDNNTILETSYYINHTGQYSIPLPLREDLSFNGFRDANHGENYIISATNMNYINLRCRQLGEWSHYNITQKWSPAGVTALAFGYNINPQMFFAFSGSTIGGYTEGGIYQIYANFGTNAQSETGVYIQVNTTTTEGTTTGLIETWEVIEYDFAKMLGSNWYYKPAEPPQDCYISKTSAPTAKDGADIKVVFQYPNTLCSRQDMLPNGNRYYKGRTDFVGFGNTNFGDIYPSNFEVPNSGTPPLVLGIDGVENTEWKRETTETNLSVPIGFSTPVDVSSIITDQLHKPTFLTKANNVGEFTYINPASTPALLIETPTFKPTTVGFTVGDGNKPEWRGTYTDYMRNYYNSVYWEDPLRITGLSFFRQFYYGLTNTDVKNEINSGINQAVNCGDYNEQTVGRLGLLPKILQYFDNDRFLFDEQGGDQYFNFITSNNQRYLPLRTNIKYTKANIAKIAAGFRIEEKDRNTDTGLPTTADIPSTLPSIPYNIATINTDNMAVKLDIGVYVDEKSQAGTLNGEGERLNNDGLIEGISAPNQQYWLKDQQQKWRASSEYDKAALGNSPLTYRTTTIAADAGRTTSYADNNTMNADTFGFGDGQELPQIWVQSRWIDGLQARQQTDFRSPLKANISDGLTDMIGANQSGSVGHEDMDMGYTYFPEITSALIGDRFERDFTDPVTGEIITYNEYLNWAIEADVAVMPYFADVDDPTWGNEPYLAFYAFDRLGRSLESAYQIPKLTYAIATEQIPYGEFFGFDCSFTRNKAVFFQNLQQKTEMTDGSIKIGGETLPNRTSTFKAAPLGMIGAVNPNIQFDGTKSRFEINGLSTPMTIGNNFMTSAFGAKVATDDPETEVYATGRIGSNYSIFTKNFGGTTPVNISAPQMRQEVGTVLDSFSGIAIESVTIVSSKDGSLLKLSEYNSTNEFLYNNTLLSKMGFNLEQLLPPIGQVQARFLPSTFIDPLNLSYSTDYNLLVKPFTTNSYISSAEYQPTATDMNRFPLYALGTAQDIQAQPSVQTASLVARNLPSKLDFPYLMVYTNLGGEMLYYGGVDSHSRLPCLAYISRNYTAGDYFYLPAGSFNLTITRDFVLTEIQTDIRLPDGSRPYLSPHSSVIYKLIRAPPPQQQIEQPQPSHSAEPNTNKKKLLGLT